MWIVYCLSAAVLGSLLLSMINKPPFGGNDAPPL
jgi:hypothetical protein